jgi:FtsZ-binding cell division protein ZapB
MRVIKMKAVRRLARPKTGRKTFPYSVALTLEQIEFLNKVPNASQLLRKLLDELISAQKDIEKQLPYLALKTQIDFLEKQAEKLKEEKEQWANEYWEYKLNKYDDEEISKGENSSVLEIKYYWKTWKAYEDAIASLRAKIKELKEKAVGLV